MTDEVLVGTIASAKLSKETDQGWKHWVIVFEDASTQRIMIQPTTDYEPKEGDEIVCNKSEFGNWTLDTNHIPGQEAKTGDGEAKTPTKSRRRTPPRLMNREDYWRNKDKYEKEIRDPKIEWQTYFEHIITIYAEGMKFLEHPPKTVKQLNLYIKDAENKATEIFEERNAKKESEPEEKTT